MAKKMAWMHFSLCSLILLSSFTLHCHGNETKRKVHIVYMGEKPQGQLLAGPTHHAMLQSVLGGSTSAKESLMYSYGRSFSGFAARLSDDEVERLSQMEGVVSVFPNRILKLHTTRSWDFMDFSHGTLGDSLEGDVIIGLLDTGIWPESECFVDEGMSAPPAKWKGICTGVNFTCNNKIIGARYYNSENNYDVSEFKSPRDDEGHGTHTSSTAAGRKVAGASYLGLGEGVARGGVPGARIAMYKVCWKFGCTAADILAAFDDAIADGVDILSASLGADGSDGPAPYFADPISIGSFHAMRHGILTSNSAGNQGPKPFSIANYAPWSLSVAASTIDRKFVAQVVLGNGDIYTGLSINSFKMHGTTYPLIWGGDAANNSADSDPDTASYCGLSSLNSQKVAGKIVLCKESTTASSSILQDHGSGAIIMGSHMLDVASNYPLPATLVDTDDGTRILNYIRSTHKPVATIKSGDTWKDATPPHVASFSSRGPNPITFDILKPDITAPGVDILAAWSPVASPSMSSGDTRSVKFNIISGTSMACPHASAAAAYVKAAHPEWSPAAIKSALMTTTFFLDSSNQPDLEFAYGSGHINPQGALDPGLVYDATEADYIEFLCKQGYNTTTLRIVTGSNTSVCTSTQPGKAWDLNYPTFAVAVEDGQQIEAVFTRTVTNVGSGNSTYSLSTHMPSVLTVTVEPHILSFSAIGEKKSFKVKVSGPKIDQQPIMSGEIIWDDGSRDGSHVVRSPLVVHNIQPAFRYSSSKD